MCELGCMNVGFLLPLDGISAAKACSLNHCNKVDPNQSFDSSDEPALVLRNAQIQHKRRQNHHWL